MFGVKQINLCLSTIVILITMALYAGTASAQQPKVAEARFTAKDTVREWADNKSETDTFLKNIQWEPGEFEVRCTATPGLRYDALVRFESPVKTGDRWLDEVVLVWYAARGEDGKAIEAPAVLMVHSLHPQMIVADQLAQQFAKQGLHTFVIQMPGYGHRWDRLRRYPGTTTLINGRQTIADCLRAKDAISVLPNIKQGPIALQGTSLGGFVAATVGGIDPSFKPVVLLISGADGYSTLTNGQHDAMYLRNALARLGYQGESLRDLLDPVEPLHVAQRLDPAQTWMINARDDQTIPRANSDALAEAVGLEDEHRLWVNANHYTAALLLKPVTEKMVQIIKGEEVMPEIEPGVPTSD